MVNTSLLREIFRYGTPRTDFETVSNYGNFQRVRVFEYEHLLYWVVQVDGEPLELIELGEVRHV